MSQCWPEGALRAHLDHELPPEDMQSLAAHLAGCAKCAGISRQLAARAARVALLMDEVSPGLVLIGAPMHATPGSRVGRAPQTRPLVARRQWIGLAAALAAGVAAAALMLPRHKTVVPVPPAAATLLPQPASIAEAANPGNPRSLTSTAAVPKRIRQSRARPPAAGAVLPGRDLRRDLKSKGFPAMDFLFLDDEPLETGVVMRVGVDPGNVQADIVFSPDGRARAVRLVNARN